MLFAALVWSSLALAATPSTPSTPQQPPAFSGSVVVTATGEEREREAVGGATTVIDRAELEAAGSPSVADALRRVPGVTLVRSGGDGGVASLFVRGAASTHTLVLRNGVRLTSPFFGGYDWSLPLTLGLERVEVVRGPYSALWGSDALGGVVHLVTADRPARAASALVEAGGDGWRRAELEASTAFGAWTLTAAAGERAGSGTLDNDDFSNRSLLLDLGRALPSGRVGVLIHRASGRSEIPFVGADRTPERLTESEETTIAAPIRLALGGAELELTLSHVERSLSFRDPGDPWGFVAGDTDADSDGARLAVRRTRGRHRLAAGLEWRADTVDDRSSFGVNLSARRLVTRSAFVQDSLQLGRGLEMLLGARWDEADPWGSELTPRGSLSWAGGNGARVWVSYGRAFRAPTLGELYYPFSGNLELAPERSYGREVGARAPLGARSSLELALFSNRVRDLIEFDHASFRFANLARARQDGVEATVRRAIGQSALLSVGLAYLDARDDAGRALLRRPAWSGSAALRGPLVRGASGELSIVWMGARDDVEPTSLARVGQPGHVTANLAVTVPLHPWLDLRARVENLTDRSYDEVRGYPAPRRRLFLALLTAIE